MTSLCFNLMALLLFLNTLPPLNLHVFALASPTAPSVTLPRIVFMTAADLDEGDDEEDESQPPEVHVPVRKHFPHQEPPQLCRHNACLEDQPPCAALSQQTGCLCPGFSGASEPPHAPRIHDLLPVREGPDSGKVEVQWCAPPSVVSGYRVIIEGIESPQEFNNSKRRGLVGHLEVGTKVCVEAVNNAGHSSTSEFSCKRYEPPTTFDHSAMVGAVAGVAILLLLIVIGTAFFCKHVICRRTKRNSNDGLGNPSYTVAGTL